MFTDVSEEYAACLQGGSGRMNVTELRTPETSLNIYQITQRHIPE
jgi:hypothetical protein